jgi:hypothetical protein
MIKKFNEFCNTILKEEYHFDEPDRWGECCGKVNIEGYIFNEFVKKYYNTNVNDKNRWNKLKDLFKKYPELEDFNNFLENNEDDFFVGVKCTWENSPSINVIDDLRIDEIDDDDFKNCIKTIESYPDKNISKKMIDVIENMDLKVIDRDDIVFDEDGYDPYNDPYKE